MTTQARYYYALPGHEPCGPLPWREVRELDRQGQLYEGTLVCLEGTEDWRNWDDELRDLESPPLAKRIYHHPPQLIHLSDKSLSVFRVLAFFFGMAGVHQFYRGDFTRGLTMFVLFVLGLGLGCLPNLATFVWSIYDLCCVKNDSKGLRMR